MRVCALRIDANIFVKAWNTGTHLHAAFSVRPLLNNAHITYIELQKELHYIHRITHMVDVVKFCAHELTENATSWLVLVF